MSQKEAVEIMCRQTSGQNIFYQTSAHIPKLNQAGQENFSRMKVDNNLEVWLIHPDLLPTFEQIARKANKSPVEFDLGRYLDLPQLGRSLVLFTDC